MEQMKKDLSIWTKRTFVLFLAVFLYPLLSAGIQGVSPSVEAENEIQLTWQERFHVKTGSMPKGVELTPDGRQAWVTNFGHDRGHSVTVFDSGNGEVIKQISFQGRAVELAFSLDGWLAYISNFDTGELMVVDTASFKVIDTVKVGINPKIVTLSPSGNRIYVSNWSSNDITVINSATLQVLDNIKVGRAPRGSDTDLSGRYLYVANFEGSTLSVVDMMALGELKVLPMKRRPRHVKLTPDGKYVLVSDMGTGIDSLAVIETASLEIKSWIKVGAGPKSIGVTPDSRLAFTAGYYSHAVTVVDLAAQKVTATIPDLGESCSGIALSKDGRTLYVTSWFSNDLWAFDLEYTSTLNPISK